MKGNLTAFSIFTLAIAIVIGSWLVSNGLKAEEPYKEESDAWKIQEKELLTQFELAEYLGITAEEVQMLLPLEVEGSITSSIPFIKIGNVYYFPIKGIDKWLTETKAVVF